jgi:hypothetical protein
VCGSLTYPFIHPAPAANQGDQRSSFSRACRALNLPSADEPIGPHVRYSCLELIGCTDTVMQRQSTFNVSTQEINVNFNINTPTAYRLLPFPPHSHAHMRALTIVATLTPMLSQMQLPLDLAIAVASLSTTGTPPDVRAARPPQ